MITNHRPIRSRGRGFTIIEMIVALGVAAILIGLIYEIYNTTTRAVSMGIQTGDIIAAHQSLGDQIYRDGLAMVGPDDGSGGSTIARSAPLMIVCKQYSTATLQMPDPVHPGEFLPNAKDPALQTLQSDQLFFFRDRGELEPIAPSNTTSFAGSATADADYVRIWYGHLDRTNTNGTRTTSLWADIADVNTTVAGWQQYLGRHAMFLNDTVSGVNADTLEHDETVSGFGSVPAAGANLTYMGLTDIANEGLSSIDVPGDALIGSTSADTTYHLYTGQAHSTGNGYPARMLELGFVVNRLNTNPTPAGTGFNSWQIAQMHPFFAMNVSDFIVEFAADANGDGSVDVDTDADGYPDIPAANATGAIVWYGWEKVPDGTGSMPAAFNFSGGTLGLDGTKSPVIRTPNNELAGTAGNADIAYVWRHDYPDNWPYLIRIRYRLHDQRGRLATAAANAAQNDWQPTPGRWFEMIIPVNRDNN